MSIRTVNREEVQKLMASVKNAILLDVLPGEYFAEEHIPGAVNACVYEVTFIEQVRAISDDPERLIIVYGSSDRSLASAKAAEKLVRAGYKQVLDFSGGLDEWGGTGCPLERNPDLTVEPPVFQEATYGIDPEKSTLLWVGRSLVGRHNGSIDLAGGTLSVSDGKVVSGELTIAMDTIKDLDLADPTFNNILVKHLKSEDFFYVENYPTASFVITRSEPLAKASPGTDNFRMWGELTMRGVTNEVEFTALIAPRTDGGVGAQAHIDIDRTRWDVLYGSGKLFEKLGIHLVNDQISLELLVVAYVRQ